MTTHQHHLELRSTGFYWRRRVPAAVKNRFKPAFFCFSLRTHVPRDAAELARRLTAVSEICFKAEQKMPPDFMTEILIAYAQIEIELADRVHALTGPRTREAGEAALALEGAARASLRDAIFLCDRSPAFQPIRDTAQRLGITLDEAEDDFAVLADKMVRTMIAVSEERERRARGFCAGQDSAITEALLRMSTPGKAACEFASLHSDKSASLNMTSAAAPLATAAALSTPVPTEQNVSYEAAVEKSEQISAAPPVAVGDEKVAEKKEATPITVHELNGRSVKLRGEHLEPARILDGSDPTVLDLWDDWFNDKINGLRVTGAYIFEDEKKGAKFSKDAEVIPPFLWGLDRRESVRSSV
ncbi:DUF6538 domain-containing protein [Sulfitobacter sp. 1A12056]|uniref:DUF6538 domain-containing protein n=1 Tax=Sulfitobacter sp. 1A12056 TaxID=3368592 RepID=UPI003746A14F